MRACTHVRGHTQRQSHREANNATYKARGAVAGLFVRVCFAEQGHGNRRTNSRDDGPANGHHLQEAGASFYTSGLDAKSNSIPSRVESGAQTYTRCGQLGGKGRTAW